MVLLSILATLIVADAHLLPVATYHAPQPYKFGYSIKDKYGQQHRQEVGDGHSGVRGSYGFTDSRGIQREVNYVADHGGFRAQVKTNEPGTANQDPAAVHMVSSAVPHAHYGGGYHVPAPVHHAYAPPVPVHHAYVPPAPVHHAYVPPAPVHHAYVPPAPVHHAYVPPAPVHHAYVPPAPVHHAYVPPPPVHHAYPAPVHHVPGYGIHHRVPGLGLGYSIALAHGSVSGYDSRY